MGTVRDRSPAPDLFSLASTREQPVASLPNLSSSAAVTTRAPASPPHVLPADLSSAIKHLDDQQFDRLVSAVVAEQKRRGKKLSISDESPPRAMRGRWYRGAARLLTRVLDSLVDLADSVSAAEPILPPRNRSLFKLEYVSAHGTELLFKICFRRRTISIGYLQRNVSPISGL